MAQAKQFRWFLPVSQTAFALAFGGWGEWERYALIVNGPGWNSTLAFHVWPWPLKFAAILNMPAFLIGVLLSIPLDALRPGLPEWMELLPSILLVPLMWYLAGVWLDRRHVHMPQGQRHWPWISTCGLVFMSLAGAAISGPRYPAAFLVFGVTLWLAVGIGMVVVTSFQKRTIYRRLRAIPPQNPM